MGPETKRRMDEVASVCKPRDKPRLRGTGSKLPLRCSLDPPRRDQAQGQALPAKRTLRDEAGALGTERPATCFELLETNLRSRPDRPPSLATTRVTSPGSALP
jgi:hypothetical protein